MEAVSELTTKKPKRLTSVVWNHFEKVKKADMCYAVCVHCNKKLSGSSNSGTTHLRNHLMRCLKRSDSDVSQLLVAKRRRKDSKVTVNNINVDECQLKDDYLKPTVVKYDQDDWRNDVASTGSSRFDQERSRLDLARMIILHGYPLAMVDHVGFKVFAKNLQPLFDVGPNSAIEVSCLEIYLREKQRVHQMMSKLCCKFNLTIEMWSSSDDVDYLSLTAHYIDEDWKLQSKVLNFITLDPSRTEDMVSEMIVKCLMEWHIEGKLFAITFDDCPPSDGIVPRTKDQILDHRPRLSNRQLFDLHSAGHMINAVVKDAINGSIEEVIRKIRRSVQYVKSSQVKLGKFSEIAECSGINAQRNLVLDSPVRWNSTYLMLETALEYRRVFVYLRDHDHEYESPLTDEEWERASCVAGHLKLFVEIKNILSRHKCLTANMYFPEICDIHIQLISWCKSPDNLLSSLALKMKSKFDKYWNKCSLALAVAAVLDPRFKMRLVEYYYSQIYGSTALDRIREVSDGIKEIFNNYSDSSKTFDGSSALPGNRLVSDVSDNRDRLKGFEKYLHETCQNQNSASDLDKYLEEPVFPRNSEFNILNWWKVHTPRYPVLSMMARDILGIPMSVAAQESAFSLGRRMLSSCYCSLSDDTRQALICARDWLQMEVDELLPFSSQHTVPLCVEGI